MTHAGGATRIGITALGMVSALGRGAATSCAAARAGLTAASELTVMDFRTQALFGSETLDGPPAVFGHVVKDVAEGFAGPGKALVLGAAALQDLMRRKALSHRELLRTGLVVNLSDAAVQDADARSSRAFGVHEPVPSATWRARTALVAQRLADMTELPIPGELQAVRHAGNAGLSLAIETALAMIREGRADRCLVGGIDSRVEPGFIKAAARLRLLRTNENPVGLIPGEGAAFFLIEPIDPRRVAIDPAGAPLAFLESVASAGDLAGLLSEAAPSGAALARAVAGALSASGAAERSIQAWLMGDLNGTERRAMEWGRALMRLRGETDVGGLPCWFPAESFGDTGAASAAMALCMAVRAFERGYAPAPRCVIWMSSEGGAKGAVVLHGGSG
ncbi:beta-ketoacyl synthase N-terminal-like domain-containing protein [Sorangium sp. So ce260]|uniref:beta-ketoacyl synthase N-terminal-like domain-containing protein n=1 Tax=Sorangium sp. So ce260 TaxID=3133291 RepID=UPI003F60FB37